MMRPPPKPALVAEVGRNDLDATDFFCGIGGSSSGLKAAGYTVALAANHSQRAIATHSANHPDTEHLCADLSNIDLRRLPRTRVLWASPICTELSPAGGRRRKGHRADKLERDGHVGNDSLIRTRVTFWEVLRAAELHRYDAVIVENVTEAGAWVLLEGWLMCMVTLGYNYQIVSVSAAHVSDDDNEPAPQWRDRVYFVFTRVGIPLPDLEPRPTAYCHKCDMDVPAIQRWKKPHARRIGKYGPQYVYVCPNETSRCQATIVEPYILPAGYAIDWSDLGTRIGDRTKELSEATMRRIGVGLRIIGDPALIGAAGNTWDSLSGASNSYVRAWPTATSPHPSQTGTAATGVAATEPFVTMLRNNGRARPVSGDALPTFSTGRNHGLTTPNPFLTLPFGGHLDPEADRAVKGIDDEPLPPAVATSRPSVVTPPGAFVSKHHGGVDYPRPEHMNKDVSTDPLPSMVAKVNNSLVVPYRKGAKVHRVADRPLSTMSTVDTHSLVTPTEPIAIEDCYFRMLSPREAANAQRFPRAYTLTGTKGEQQLGAGNAVACNVAQWLGRQVAAVLEGVAA